MLKGSWFVKQKIVHLAQARGNPEKDLIKRLIL